MQVSIISLGNMTFNKVTPEIEEQCYKCITKAYEGGINYFDTAEMYGFGCAETVLGKCFKKAGWPRKDFVLSTKIFKSGDKPNDTFLSRKHIIEGTLASLSRLQLDYTDIIFAHRYDPLTPMEETCRAFNWLIDHGKAFYWATSDWTPEEIMEAFACCDRLGLARPVADQIEYNPFVREKFEVSMAPMFEKYGYGTTVWSPLCGGYLTGKYNDKKMPEASRYTPGLWPKHIIDTVNRNYIIGGDEELFYKRLKGLAEVANEFKCNQVHFYLAWCLVNKDVSTAIVGATKPEQIEDNLKAVEIVKKWTPEMEKRVNEVMANIPSAPLNWRTWKPHPDRRTSRIDYAS